MGRGRSAGGGDPSRVCADTATFGGEQIALINLVNSASPPGIISVSYGQCETDNGASGNYQIYTTAQQAVAEGISLFVASGDGNAAVCDQSSGTPRIYGITVNGLASTPYNVAVGGTDFEDTYLNATARYWSSDNGATYKSAMSYIPEIPWNDLRQFPGGLQFELCADLRRGGILPVRIHDLFGEPEQQLLHYVGMFGGSGGPSGCATGTPASLFTSAVGGTCAGYPKPNWQTGVFGIPNDNVRDLPDVSLFAGTGYWGHSYIVCFSQLSAGGASCAGNPGNWFRGGGTSFATPVWPAFRLWSINTPARPRAIPITLITSSPRRPMGPAATAPATPRWERTPPLVPSTI